MKHKRIDNDFLFQKRIREVSSVCYNLVAIVNS